MTKPESVDVERGIGFYKLASVLQQQRAEKAEAENKRLRKLVTNPDQYLAVAQEIKAAKRLCEIYFAIAAEHISEDGVRELRDRILREDAPDPDYKERYYDLIYQVQTKHPDESRHDTAKRYIVNAETPKDNQACAKAPDPDRKDG